MSAKNARVRYAIATLPERFNTADAFAACPFAARHAVSGVLSAMVAQGELTDAGLVVVTITINGANSCGTRRRLKVRNFRRAEAKPAALRVRVPSIDLTVIDYPGRDAVATNWQTGSATIAAVMTRWPGSPLPEEYAR